MIITFYGQSCIKLQAGDTIIGVNPFSTSKTLKTPKFGADIALANRYDEDFANFDALTYGEKEPRAIYGPGSYEVDGIHIDGYGVEDPGEGFLTAYRFIFDGMRIVLLGSMYDKATMPPELLEAIADADVMFVDCTQPNIYTTASSFSPKLIIPVGFEAEKDIHLKEFLADIPKDKQEIKDKLTIKPKDIAAWQSHVVVAKP